MTLLDEPSVSKGSGALRRPEVIDLTDELTRTALASPRPDLEIEGAEAMSPSDGRRDRVPARSLRGMRVQRVRLGSVATLAAVFFVLGYVVVLTTLVLLWNAGRSAGLVSDLEDLVITSLGLETFAIDGGSLFTMAAVGGAVAAALGWLLTVLLAAVYNAACALFGGLALETSPLRRRSSVGSLRELLTSSRS